MVQSRAGAYLSCMQATSVSEAAISTLSSSPAPVVGAGAQHAAAAVPPARGVLPAAVVLVAFVSYSLWVAWVDGPVGFLPLAWREPWGMQLLLDLGISLFFALTWLTKDARKRGFTPLPWILGTAIFGSPGLLLYAVRRGFGGKR